jgi:hypothetical protein
MKKIVILQFQKYAPGINRMIIPYQSISAHKNQTIIMLPKVAMRLSVVPQISNLPTIDYTSIFLKGTEQKTYCIFCEKDSKDVFNHLLQIDQENIKIQL